MLKEKIFDIKYFFWLNSYINNYGSKIVIDNENIIIASTNRHDFPLYNKINNTNFKKFKPLNYERN